MAECGECGEVWLSVGECGEVWRSVASVKSVSEYGRVL